MITDPRLSSSGTGRADEAQYRRAVEDARSTLSEVGDEHGWNLLGLVARGIWLLALGRAHLRLAAY